MSAGRRKLHAGLLVMLVAASSNCGGSSDLNTAQGSFVDACPRPPPRRFAAGDSIVLTTLNDYPCTVEFRPTGIRLLPDPEGKRPDPGPRVVRDRNGRFFSANATGFSSVVAVWAEDGSFLTTLGRPGEGPGEFDPRGGLALHIDDNGQLHVRDNGGYWSTFSPSLEFLRKVRSANMGGRPGHTVLTRQGVLVTSQPLLSDPDHEFHVVNLNGELVRGIGPIGQRQVARRARELRPIAYGGGTTFWAAPASGDGRGYVIEEWTETGDLRRVIRREVPWFTMENSRAATRPSDRPPPFVESIHADTAGFVTTFIVAPNDDWKHVREADDPETAFEFFDGIVEVIDTRAGVVLASRRMAVRDAMQEIHGLFPGVRLGYRMRDSGDDLPIVEIVRLLLIAA